MAYLAATSTLYIHMNDVYAQHNWTIDPVHSSIRFGVKYLELTVITGWFSEFEGTLNGGFQGGSLWVNIYTHSIFTGNAIRDAHLRSTEFFESDRFPSIVYQSTQLTLKDNQVHTTGSLTIKDTTQNFKTESLITGIRADERGNIKAGVVTVTRINRNAFGIGSGGMIIAEEVYLHCDIQLLQV
ncbi:YceI family protein [uncultured Chitinophaga sp.]|uniref:YceI family protein n=1 Tax=uncultured Chitinophaga sp. TaxID=339340 RepID=UPI0025FCE959|nr:YceI family protein [uncultured Chitinophaga sp.]